MDKLEKENEFGRFVGKVGFGKAHIIAHDGDDRAKNKSPRTKQARKANADKKKKR